MPSAADLQLAREVRDLIQDGQAARDDARTPGPAFQSWFPRAEARVARLGPRADVFAVASRTSRRAMLTQPAWSPRPGMPWLREQSRWSFISGWSMQRRES